MSDVMALKINLLSNNAPNLATHFVSHEPFCRQCFRRASQLYPGQHLKACESCHLESYCSNCGQQDHAQECEQLKLYYQDQLFLVQSIMEGCKLSVDEKILTSKLPLNAYQPIHNLANWYDYYTKVVNIDRLSSWVTSSWALKVHHTEAVETAGFLRRSSDVTSSVLTILAALEAVFPDLGSKTTIRLHIIGAENYEFGMLQSVEEILHVLPNLEELSIHFIGPGLPADEIDKYGLLNTTEIDCCKNCTSTKRRVTLSLWQGLYHDYLATSSYTQPDLAVAFHPGWTFLMTNAGWLPTINHLARAEHATLFTSFNEGEIYKEMVQINGRYPKVRFVQNAEINKWKAMCAYITPMFMADTPPTKENRFFFKNHYWYIFTGM